MLTKFHPDSKIAGKLESRVTCAPRSAYLHDSAIYSVSNFSYAQTNSCLPEAFNTQHFRVSIVWKELLNPPERFVSTPG